MKHKIIFFILIFLFYVSVVHTDTKPYWVLFTDRGAINVEKTLAVKKTSLDEPKARCRRARVMGVNNIFDERDLPVNPEYSTTIKKIAGNLRTVTRYFNGVSVNMDEEALEKVKNLPFVRLVKPVAGYRGPLVPEKPGMPKPGTLEESESLMYGNSFSQVNMVGAVGLHNLGYLGKGITIAVLDSGFDNLEHAAFDSIRVSYKRDFVEGDDDPAGDDHGSKVLAIIAALDHKNMIGVAPYANYMLARTEIMNPMDISSEEDYWVAGVEWADSLGADIINSSLGYFEFEDRDDYTYEDLDGETAVTTIAANIAVEKGIVVVTSAGNEGNTEWHYITTPADGDSVLAVGSVDINGIISPSSSRGPTYDGRIKPDFVAQGRNVWLPNINTQDSYEYSFFGGTSFAAPAVSGAVALLLEVNPSWKPADVRQTLLDTASDMGIAGPDSLYGYGTIDALAASGLEIPEPPVAAFRANPPYPQPVSFKDINSKLFFPVDIPSEGTVSIKIFSFSGENVNTIENYYTTAGKKHDRIEAPNWDGTNFTGDDVAPGIYYYTIRLFGYNTYTGKIAVIR